MPLAIFAVFLSGRGAQRPGFKYKSKISAIPQKRNCADYGRAEIDLPQPRYTVLVLFQFFTNTQGRYATLFLKPVWTVFSWTDDNYLAAP